MILSLSCAFDVEKKNVLPDFSRADYSVLIVLKSCCACNTSACRSFITN